MLKKLLLIISLFLVLVAIYYSLAFTYSYSIQEKNSLESINNIVLEKEFSLKSINFLFLGIPGKEYAAPWLTDTIIVGSFNSNNGSVSLISIPRDLIIKIPDSGNITKINALYSLGKTFSPLEPIKFIKEKITEITGLKIDYYILIDVIGLERFIDSVGGVNITVSDDISDPRFPGANYSYEPFYLSAGFHNLNGHEAVRFARSRNSLRGDFDRIQRQRQLIQALKNQIFAKNLNLQWLIKSYKDLNDRLISNLELDDLPILFKAARLISNKNISDYSLEISPNGLLKETDIILGGVNAYAIIPKK
ncbi:MAG: LCP family protein [Patescibacteria group bacterium]